MKLVKSRKQQAHWPPADGFVVVVKDDCPTCRLVPAALEELLKRGFSVSIISQDDPRESSVVGTVPIAGYPDRVQVWDDSALERSYQLNIETVPTLVRFEDGNEVGRAVGWVRDEWKALTSVPELGEGMPASRPGCGSRSVAPGVPEYLQARFGETGLSSRQMKTAPYQDSAEFCFERGWTDGLPVVPPTAERVLRMLKGTARDPGEVIGDIPPDYAACTVEKAAINAVLAGCKPEYMPVLLAALEASLDPGFTLHGILCSTCFSSPLIVVNGPVAQRIGMNCGLNVLGQGNRANATIGRALNLIVRNVGGGRPGEIDRATFGAPSKFTFCFAEDESDPEWEPLSVARGFEPGVSTVTLFQGEGVQGVMDQRSRTPEALTRSLAASLLAVCHPKICEWARAVLVLSPEHYAVYREAGWGRKQITEALFEATTRKGSDVVEGAGGLAEGIPADSISSIFERVPKFPPEGLTLVRAGGPAGLYSAILAGWPGNRDHDQSFPVSKAIIS